MGILNERLPNPLHWSRLVHRQPFYVVNESYHPINISRRKTINRIRKRLCGIAFRNVCSSTYLQCIVIPPLLSACLLACLHTTTTSAHPIWKSFGQPYTTIPENGYVQVLYLEMDDPSSSSTRHIMLNDYAFHRAWFYLFGWHADSRMSTMIRRPKQQLQRRLSS